MYLDRDRVDSKLSLVDKDGTVLSMSWFFDEFTWIIESMEPIVITREVDEILFNNLCNLLNNEYKFYISNELSNQSNNRIQWFSDQAVNLEDEFSTDTINRLVIERIEDKIVISVFNPFLNKNGIIRKSYVVAFSPGGNGYQTRNVKTCLSFQDDIVRLFSYTMDGIDMNGDKDIQKKLK